MSDHGRAPLEHLSVNPMFARKGSIPRWRMPDDEMQPETAYQVIHDEIFLDGNARQNLATFVTTWMEPQASALYAEAFDKNMIDKDEYPQTAAIEERCVHILADSGTHRSPARRSGRPRSARRRPACSQGSRQAALAAAASGRGRALGHAEHRVQQLGPGRVGEVRELLGDRGRGTSRSRRSDCLTPEGMLEAVDEHTIGVVGILGVDAGTNRSRTSRRRWTIFGSDRARRAAPRRRRVRGVHRSVPRSRPGVGLPAPPRALDQHIGTSSGWCIRAWAGWCGRRPRTSPRT